MSPAGRGIVSRRRVLDYRCASRRKSFGGTSLRRGLRVRFCSFSMFLMTSSVVRCAAPPAQRENAARDVVSAASDLSTSGLEDATRRLFEAAHQIHAGGDASSALRVLALCKRLDSRSMDLDLAMAEMQCRSGKFVEAHARFRLVLARARQRCPEIALQSPSRSMQGKRSCSETERNDALVLMISSNARHGMCLMEARRFGVAAAYFREALALDQGLDGVAWHLGLACDYGGDWPGAVDAYLHWLHIQHTGAPVIDVKRPTGVQVVAIFCLHRTPDAPGGRWGSHSLEQQGIGGSEEAVILLSRELAALGYHVEVYAYPPDEEVGADGFGVWWLPVHWYNAIGLAAPDIFVSWRGYALATQGGPSALNFLWLHDRVIPQLAPPALVAQLTGVLVLSEHHKAQLPRHAAPKAILTRNGVAASFWQEGPNHASHFIFASHPERGLAQLLEVWPRISAGVPGARLDIYHGFPDKYGEAGAPEQELAKMRSLRQRVEQLLRRSPRVHMHGMVNQTVLAQAYARAGFWLYPTSMAETSCISAMKAMGNGAIPITSRLPKSGLVETTGPYDLGPVPVRPSASLETDVEMLESWVKTVIEAARDDAAGRLAHKRQEMIKWARYTYSWSAVARQWVTVFESHRS